MSSQRKNKKTKQKTAKIQNQFKYFPRNFHECKPKKQNKNNKTYKQQQFS